MIWRRTSSIDDVDKVSPGFSRPSTSQRNFLLPIERRRLGEAFIHQDGYEGIIAFLQHQRYDLSDARQASVSVKVSGAETRDLPASPILTNFLLSITL